MSDSVLNPLSQRFIARMGALHRKLIRAGVMNQDGSVGPNAPSSPKIAEIAPSPAMGKAQPKQRKPQPKPSAAEPQDVHAGREDDFDALMRAYVAKHAVKPTAGTSGPHAGLHPATTAAEEDDSASDIEL